VVIQSLRRRRRLAPADAGPIVEIPCLGKIRPADGPLADFFDAFDHLRPTAALIAHLHMAFVLAGRLYEQLPLARVITAWLFGIDVLVRQTSQNRRRRMPVV